jgi:Protein of Unknown function (DUF2784)
MSMAHLVLAIHVAIIAFNVAGLIVIPLGARLGWSFVRASTWRVLHVISWGVVALQAAAGRACFLTDWQHALAGGEEAPEPLVARLVNAAIYWPLPLWVFTVLYAAAFAWIIALLWIVPPVRRLRPRH